MDFDLLKLRLIAFGWDCARLAGLSLIGILSSEAFASIVEQHFGATIIGALILAAANGLVMHLRNIALLRGYEDELAGGGDADQPILL